MAVKLPCQVMIWFGRPIEPRRVTYPKVLMDVTGSVVGRGRTPRLARRYEQA